MTATFPAVFLYQVLGAPIVITILSIAWLIGKATESAASPMAQSWMSDFMIVALASSAFLVMVGASMFGFVEGWRIG